MPRSIATQHTLKFIQRFVPLNNIDFLEVGCGKGHLAVELEKQGAKVTAIDLSLTAIQQAKEMGVDAVEADILSFNPKRLFDVVLFSRSLHHINPVEKAILNAFELLKPSGTLLVEDFSIDKADLETASWHYSVHDLVEIFAGEIPSQETNALERWQKEHEEHLPIHPSMKMQSAIKEVFDEIKVETCPYLYRSAIPELEKLKDGVVAMKSLFAHETRLIEQNLIEPIGLRIIARKNN